MTKNSKLFYEARDAVQNESYLKSKSKTLRKYLGELSIVQPWESDPLASGAVGRKREWIEKIKTELQSRKVARRRQIRSIAISLLKYIVAPLIVLIIGFFLVRYFQQADQSSSTAQGLKTLIQEQSIPALVSPDNPISPDKPQPGEKRK